MTRTAADPLTATPPPAPPRPAAGRLLAVALVVFAANAGLLVLQLAAGRLLVPFVGSSLETWTAIIGVFLAGIALGNAAGGQVADRHPSPRRLAVFLMLGAMAAGWMVVFPKLLADTGAYTALPLGIRIPLLAAAECFPAGFALSLLTPVAIKLGLPDVRRAGRAAGRVFAVGTLGCLAGNYATGFVLIPSFTIDTITLGTAASLLACAGLAWLMGNRTEYPVLGTRYSGSGSGSGSGSDHSSLVTRNSSLNFRKAVAIVFLCSFAGMTLELTAARVLAQVLGVSLYTWTGVIGVMLAGTALGNWAGGLLADRGGTRARLAFFLALAAGGAVLSVFAFFALTGGAAAAFDGLGLVPRVLAWTFAPFFLPMFLLGTISPQVIRQTASDGATAGRTAGRVYAWSTAGAIAGTFACGYVLLPAAGMYATLMLAALLPATAALLADRVWERRAVVYTLGLVVGCAVGGVGLFRTAKHGITAESTYFTIRVKEVDDDPPTYVLQLDLLVHSRVRPSDPTYLHYPHEQIQIEFLRAAGPDARVLVIGGGGYTFPRAVRTEFPRSSVDVVEIDPAVTAVCYSHLGLDPRLGIRSHHMDGRQFVAEKAAPGGYDLVTLDAVNDLSVPYHLLTKECNDAVKRALSPGGVYLVTVIDTPGPGKLWKAAFHTLRQTFAHVELLAVTNVWQPGEQMPYVLYASDVPLDLEALRAATKRTPRPAQAALAGGLGASVQGHHFTHRPPDGEVERLLAADPPVLLTDQFAPVDNLMAGVFRQRKGAK